jgi:hypothetical protein
MEAAQRRLDALENIPDADPFTDGTVLLVRWKQYTYAALRMRSFWYTTGKQSPNSQVSGLYRVPWAQFVDWLVEGNVKELVEMGEMGRLSLVDPPSDYVVPLHCTIGNVHEPHDWFYDQQSSPGTEGPWTRAHCRGVEPVGTQTHPATQLPHTRAGGWCSICGGTGDPAFIHLDMPVKDEERIRELAAKVALWRSVATNPLTGVTPGKVGRSCDLREPHGPHLWPAETGSLVSCYGRLEPKEDASGKQG